MSKRLTLLLILALALGACNSFNPTPQVATQPVLATLEIPATTESLTGTLVADTATAAPSGTPAPSATAEPKDYGPANFPAGINPLTGLPASDPALLDRRPVAVKIQTFPRGQRPDWGVTLADIVYDYYQNNGMTRLHAIFYSNDVEQAGPIRSARMLDIHLVRMYKSIFAFGGADKRIYNKLLNAEFADRLVVEGNKCPPMCRVDPNGNNFLVANTEELSKYVSTQGVSNGRQDLNGMTFKAEAPAGGQPVTQVYTRYSISAYNRWDYDAAARHYLRFQDTQEDTGQGEGYEPFVDRQNNQQVAADNVVILFVPHSFSYKSGNSEIVEVDLKGSGIAYAFRDGQVYQVKWSRAADTDLLSLTNADGSPFGFKPGVTWFEVIGQSSQMQKQSDGALRFTFAIP